jgi:asparagine synthase (glutamine-hydrolysing)
MCGIAGTVGWPDGASVADRLIDVLGHRGPDGAGSYRRGAVQLRHRRLSILDLSPTGAQPMERDGLALTYNGELYNAPELRRELSCAGVRFRGSSDTEVVLQAWRRWGTDCLPRLRGMFAFAVHDQRTREVTLVRDQLGIKPLFWVPRAGGVLFASELKAILAVLGPSLRIDAGAMVASLLYYWVPDTRCAFVGVHKLQPGCWLRISPDGGLVHGRYWSLADVAAAAAQGPQPDLAEVIADSTRRHLLADVEVGAFLSGGLDSSYLTALAARDRPGLQAWTIAFRDADAKWEAMPDDLRYARQVAGRFGVRLHEIEIAPQITAELPRMVHTLDEPIGDPAAFNQFLICSAAREAGIKVLLSGMGADELFAGYRKHAANLLALRYQRLPQPLRRSIGGVVDRLPVSGRTRGYRTVRFAKRFLSFAEAEEQTAFRRSYTLYDGAELSAALHPDLAPLVDDVLNEHAAVYADQRLDDHVNRMCLADARLFLPGLNLAYTDRASMAASTEVRVPFVDVEVVRAAFAYPGSRKIVGRRGKVVLKQAAAGVLPAEIIHRPKGLFSAPLRAWMSRDLAPVLREVAHDGALVSTGLMRTEAITALMAQDAAGVQDRAKQLWHILTLEYWYRAALAAGAAPATGGVFSAPEKVA